MYTYTRTMAEWVRDERAKVIASLHAAHPANEVGTWRVRRETISIDGFSQGQRDAGIFQGEYGKVLAHIEAHGGFFNENGEGVEIKRVNVITL